jgi:acyl-CoA dehydrogenase
MTLEESDIRSDLRSALRELCAHFPGSYWQELDARREYPEEFVAALTAAGYLAALIPESYGGLGLGIEDASIILEEISHCGGNPAAVHAQMYTMGTLLRHGSDEQKQEFLPAIAAGRLRLQAFAVTEPTAGSDTASITTRARRENDEYVVNGQKVFISRVEQSDLMIVLARTSAASDVGRPVDGLSAFLVDLRVGGHRGGLTVRPLRTMMNHHTSEVFFDDLRIPASSLIGDEGSGFTYLLDGLNAERILIAAECIGDGRWFVERAVQYASTRIVFGRPIGQNQGIQFPIARAHINIEAADCMRRKAAKLFDAGLPCGPEANMSKLLAADASWEAANVALQTHGGYGFVADYDIERKLRETRLYQIAPVSTNLILAYVGQHVLGLPRSY